MYNNPYFNNYNMQNSLDSINNNIAELEKLKTQLQNRQNQPAINQTFQLAPTQSIMRYANTIEDVNKEVIVGDTPFFSRDLSVVWIKNIKGEIKTYELNEIIPKDDKDFQIDYLREQIEELKGMIKNDRNDTNDVAKQNETNTTEYDESIRATTKNEKSTGISKVSTSKKR